VGTYVFFEVDADLEIVAGDLRTFDSFVPVQAVVAAFARVGDEMPTADLAARLLMMTQTLIWFRREPSLEPA